MPLQVTVASSAAAVQQSLEELSERPENDPVRRVDPETGQLELYSSVAELCKAMPSMPTDMLKPWTKMPIFIVRLFVEKRHFSDGGIDRAYAVHEFPLGEPLMKAIVWWRKRVKKQCSGFAIFEGGFDMSGPIYLTPPPRLFVDSASGEVEGDDEEECEKKKALHFKRLQIDERWEAKGVPEGLRQKIESAELRVAERRRKGQEYMLGCGWVEKGHGMDLSRHNDIQKRFPPQANSVPEGLRQKIESAELRAAERRQKGQEYMLGGGCVEKGHGMDLSRHNDIQKKFPPQAQRAGVAKPLLERAQQHTPQLDALGRAMEEEDADGLRKAITLAKQAGVSSADVKAADHMLLHIEARGQLRAAMNRKKEVGHAASTLKQAGFNAMELKDAGYATSTLKHIGFHPTELKEGGYAGSTLKQTGFNARKPKDESLKWAIDGQRGPMSAR